MSVRPGYICHAKTEFCQKSYIVPLKVTINSQCVAVMKKYVHAMDISDLVNGSSVNLVADQLFNPHCILPRSIFFRKNLWKLWTKQDLFKKRNTDNLRCPVECRLCRLKLKKSIQCGGVKLTPCENMAEQARVQNNPFPCDEFICSWQTNRGVFLRTFNE